MALACYLLKNVKKYVNKSFSAVLLMSTYKFRTAIPRKIGRTTREKKNFIPFLSFAVDYFLIL